MTEQRFQVGQTVVVVSGAAKDTYTFAQVVRVTPSGQIVVRKGGYETKFNSNGRELGGNSWSSSYLTEITPEIEEDIKRRTLLSQISKFKWDALPTDVLEEIAAIVKSKI